MSRCGRSESADRYSAEVLRPAPTTAGNAADLRNTARLDSRALQPVAPAAAAPARPTAAAGGQSAGHRYGSLLRSAAQWPTAGYAPERDRFTAGAIRPVRVLDDQHHGPLIGQILQQTVAAVGLPECYSRRSRARPVTAGWPAWRAAGSGWQQPRRRRGWPGRGAGRVRRGRHRPGARRARPRPAVGAQVAGGVGAENLVHVMRQGGIR
jgi:hypothetical protein